MSCSKRLFSSTGRQPVRILDDCEDLVPQHAVGKGVGFGASVPFGAEEVAQRQGYAGGSGRRGRQELPGHGFLQPAERLRDLRRSAIRSERRCGWRSPARLPGRGSAAADTESARHRPRPAALTTAWEHPQSGHRSEPAASGCVRHLIGCTLAGAPKHVSPTTGQRFGSLAPGGDGTQRIRCRVSERCAIAWKPARSRAGTMPT